MITTMGNPPSQKPPAMVPLSQQGTWLRRLAWLPIPLLAAAIIVGRAAGLNESYKSEHLTLALSFTFYTLVSLGTLFLIGRSFLASGMPGLLLLECGVVLWSLAGTVGDAVSHGDANVNVTIFNTVILLAGLCHLAGAIISLRPQRALRATPLWLGAGCVLALGALWLVTRAALANRLPIFFIPGYGGTAVRYCVLISAIAMFVLSAGLLLAGKRAARTPFTSWYSLALLLLAVGLFGVMIQLSLGSVVNWLGRMAQWLGGVYLLLAAVAALRDSHLPLLPPEEKPRPERYRYGVAIAIVLAAAAVRLAFLQMLGMRAAFITFYPAVMLAALYGGLRAGLLATALSALAADYFWIEPAGQLSIRTPADWLGMAIFIASCTVISWITEVMHRAQSRALAAESEAKVAVEREQAAKVLRESEERYRTLFDTLIEGFCIIEVLFDPDGKAVDYRFLEINAVFEARTGLRDAQGKRMRELAPDHEEYWFEIYGKVASTGEPARFVNEAKALGRWYDVNAYRVGSPDSRKVAILFNDITERKRAEEVLRESEERFRTAFEDGVIPMTLTAMDGRLLKVNAAFCQMLGYTEAELAGHSFADLTHPDDLDVNLAGVQRLVNGEVRSFRMEKRYIRKDGRIICVDMSTASVQDAYGKPLYLVTHVPDITERKAAEELLKVKDSAIASCLNAIAIADLQGRLTYVNPACVRLWGYEGEHEVLGRSVLDFWQEPQRAADVVQAIRNGAGWVGELIAVTKGGSPRDLYLSASTVLDEAGAPICIMASFIDITERKQSEQQLKELNETLEKRVAERTAVAEVRAEQLRMLAQELTQAEQRERHRIAHILHEHFQQLLVGAKMSLSMVQTQGADSQEAMRRTDQILSEAVEASRSLAVELSPPILRYGGLAPALGWLGQWMHEKHGLNVEVAAEPHVPMPPEDVQVMLFQAARELLFNVVKHAKVDRAKVELKQEAGQLLRLSVSDKGVGFQTGEFVAKACTPGGFGLFSIRERLSFLEGRVEIQSAPGAGTCISLLVPLPPVAQAGAAARAAAESPAIASAANQDGATGPRPAAGPKIKVLIADDHAVVRDGMSRLLQTLPDMQVVGIAKDGREVVELAVQLRPDVVVMDVSMPEMNGIEATRCILADLPATRIIGLSMHADQDVAERMRQAGAAAYLAKSGPTDGLVAAIRAAWRCRPSV